jgi:hypothetical protein
MENEQLTLEQTLERILALKDLATKRNLVANINSAINIAQEIPFKSDRKFTEDRYLILAPYHLDKLVEDLRNLIRRLGDFMQSRDPDTVGRVDLKTIQRWFGLKILVDGEGLTLEMPTSRKTHTLFHTSPEDDLYLDTFTEPENMTVELAGHKLYGIDFVADVKVFINQYDEESLKALSELYLVKL